MMEIKLTTATAEDLLLALQDYLHQRIPVREYVDKRYASQDEVYRNHKIGEVQGRVTRLQGFARRLEAETDAQTELRLQTKGESK